MNQQTFLRLALGDLALYALVQGMVQIIQFAGTLQNLDFQVVTVLLQPGLADLQLQICPLSIRYILRDTCGPDRFAVCIKRHFCRLADPTDFTRHHDPVFPVKNTPFSQAKPVNPHHRTVVRMNVQHETFTAPGTALRYAQDQAIARRRPQGVACNIVCPTSNSGHRLRPFELSLTSRQVSQSPEVSTHQVLDQRSRQDKNNDLQYTMHRRMGGRGRGEKPLGLRHHKNDIDHHRKYSHPNRQACADQPTNHHDDDRVSNDHGGAHAACKSRDGHRGQPGTDRQNMERGFQAPEAQQGPT